MDPGEAFEDTGRREVREEIGVDIDELELLGVFSGPEYYYRYPHGDEVFNVTVAYTARVAGGEIRPDHAEIGEATFFEPAELPADILGPERPIVDKYLGMAETS
ncbi:NUDIX domain-containing protein [Amycolatopsis palatopharyngis]|uniref:NUDIX domain-containing protein n=1 Tax=Amycolatopsis palatopharyngis TaxID=187982 RepID=UPI000E230C69|nr:NUDIX domain-containing protein [Amycolatopsis palatopharyngis]